MGILSYLPMTTLRCKVHGPFDHMASDPVVEIPFVDLDKDRGTMMVRIVDLPANASNIEFDGCLYHIDRRCDSVDGISTKLCLRWVAFLHCDGELEPVADSPGETVNQGRERAGLPPIVGGYKLPDGITMHNIRSFAISQEMPPSLKAESAGGEMIVPPAFADIVNYFCVPAHLVNDAPDADTPQIVTKE